MERRTESVNTLNSLRNDSIFQDTKLHHLKFLKQVQQTRDDLKLLITENQFVNQLLIIVAFINLIWLLIILLFLVQENVKLTLSVFLTVLIKEVPSLLLIWAAKVNDLADTFFNQLIHANDSLLGSSFNPQQYSALSYFDIHHTISMNIDMNTAATTPNLTYYLFQSQQISLEKLHLISRLQIDPLGFKLLGVRLTMNGMMIQSWAWFAAILIGSVRSVLVAGAGS
jgi:hypothetical protein